jgi:hypothetical protein
MRRPSTRGKHETEGSKRNQEGVREEEMQAPEGRREDNLAGEGTLDGEDEELGGEDEFMYASTSKNGMTGKDIRETEKAEVMREVEDDKLSVLGEEYEDEGRENQREEVKEEQLLVSEEEEWEDTELEREAQEIEENSKKEAAETVEGEDMPAKTKRGDKLAVKANQASAETDRKAIEDTKRELRKNPYVKSANEKGDRREKERESVLTEEEEFVTPVKSNKKKGELVKNEAQAASEDKTEDDSGEESVATVQQSNIKVRPTQVSPKRDL